VEEGVDGHGNEDHNAGEARELRAFSFSGVERVEGEVEAVAAGLTAPGAAERENREWVEEGSAVGMADLGAATGWAGDVRAGVLDQIPF